MGQKTRLATSVGVVSFLLGLLFAVTYTAEYALRTGDPSWFPTVGESTVQTLSLYYMLVGIVGFLLSPVLVFALAYLFGRRLDFPREYVSIAGSLAVGSLVGYGLGRILTFGWMVSLSGGSFDFLAMLGFVLPALVRSVVVVTLVGFAGTGLAYVVHDRDASDGATGEAPNRTLGD